VIRSGGAIIAKFAIALIITLICVTTCGAAAAKRHRMAPATAPTTTTRAAEELGPDVVILKELVALYEPVPFDHRSHAAMSQMWDGCTTCHHRPPQSPATRAAAASRPVDTHDQQSSERIPACKSCHELGDDRAAADVRMPSLKGAYHRQCLNCHKEWTHENACVKCHQPLNKRDPKREIGPTADDIVGRMHPPIPPPADKVYTARFTPAAGNRVLFRHKEHVEGFGLKCVSCHHQDRCANCHDPGGVRTSHPLTPGRTWKDSHGPCAACHQQDRCDHCHHPEGQPDPPPFEHRLTGQILDKDHATLACADCHAQLKLKQTPTCGGATCHKSRPTIALPNDRPGSMAPTATQPAPGVSAAAAEQEITIHDDANPTTRPTTRPRIVRIRK
jgi:hypothetical protein